MLFLVHLGRFNSILLHLTRFWLNPEPHLTPAWSTLVELNLDQGRPPLPPAPIFHFAFSLFHFLAARPDSPSPLPDRPSLTH